MEPFVKIKGLVATLDRVNVDTDQIIPKQFLKRIEKTGYGQFLFFDWRLNEDGSPNPDFELNAPQFKGASILLTRDNFGCGSSREHAPWALLDYGFHSILAPSFADIFYNNCFKNGMLPVQLPQDQISDLFEWVGANPGAQLTVDLESQTLSGDSLEYPFEVDPFRRDCLLKGLNDIDLTLQYEEQIREYESKNG
ncbi:MAG: 3-isopropylmalate dehydratase small subunit [Acidobacteriota bacterium]|nr:3-isopropylmalate dehydratase small subunit [Acidobacteriota bacterium]MCH8017896.1 3-isopropylmalate dehydratase small subunit [Acidobacteriota bacterium]TDI13537.1 MAG: 3-isopropylmalate dehydratase small subunit [Acidobacteriota bacterium]TDI15390.1 MAG: 3-isopropylmalate dehydratase small subunit [Acidobacteriota bacterium]